MKDQVKQYYIGIDVSKSKLDIYFNDKSYVIDNIEEAITSFIKEVIGAEEVALCTLESTGGYERKAIRIFTESGIAVHRAHPNKVHSFAKVSNHFAKTDKLDAILLHKYAIFIAQNENKKGDRVISKNMEDLKALKKVSIGMERELHAAQCKLKQVPKAAHRYLKKEIVFLKRIIADIHKEQLRIVKSDATLTERMTIMCSMKGIGEKISIALLSELPELGTLEKGQVAALCGVAPRTYQSGLKNAARSIYGGRFNVRKNLYMAALVAVRKSPWATEKYQILLSKGKAKKVALVAIMRKIIIIINSMIKNMTPYNFNA